MMDASDQKFIQKQLENFLFDEESVPKWSYADDTGPNDWGDLCDDFKLCQTGSKQSPINIKNAEKDTKNQLEVLYKNAPLKAKYNDHSLYVHFDASSDEHIIFNQKKYQLVQLHFHAPSEHWLKDEVYPMEIHCVHKSDDGRLLVIGVFVKEGKENAYLKDLFQHTPFKKGHDILNYPSELNPADLLPENQTFYQYMGSLTTPPCSEEVIWIVMDKSIQASTDQIKIFKEKIINQNIRPIQKTNDRKITITEK